MHKILNLFKDQRPLTKELPCIWIIIVKPKFKFSVPKQSPRDKHFPLGQEFNKQGSRFRIQICDVCLSRMCRMRFLPDRTWPYYLQVQFMYHWISWQMALSALMLAPGDSILCPGSDLTSDPHVVSLITLFTRYVSPRAVEAYTISTVLTHMGAEAPYSFNVQRAV